MLGLKSILPILMLLGIFFLIPAKTHAFDLFQSNPCSITDSKKAKSPICQQGSAQTKDKNPLASTIQVASSTVALLAGVLAVIMIVISGFTLITSGGNQDAVTNSRKRITSAIIGLVIISLAWTIIRLITDHVIQ